MRELLLFEPTIKNYIWGNEYWTVSAHPHGDDVVKNGVRTDPFFRPEYAPETFLSYRDIPCLYAVRKDFLKEHGF